MVLLCSQKARSPDFLHKAGEYSHGCYFIFRSASWYQRQGRKCVLVGCASEIFPDKLFCDLIYNPHDHGYFIWHTYVRDEAFAVMGCLGSKYDYKAIFRELSPVSGGKLSDSHHPPCPGKHVAFSKRSVSPNRTCFPVGCQMSLLRVMKKGRKRKTGFGRVTAVQIKRGKVFS